MDKHEFVEFNTNDYVWVKLTDLGKKVDRDNHDAFLACTGLRYPYQPPAEDEDGWSKWQLWHLAHIFGAYHGMGGPLPHKTTIRFAKKDLKEV